MPLLTLTMIVKNEEKFLEECLNSVSGIADEIVVVDTGSIDKTIEIAQKSGAQIYNFDWVDDFSAARNFALSKASGDWVLYLDADERIDPGSLHELEKIKNSKDSRGYFCTVKSQDCENNRDNSMRYVRLFRNVPGIRFRGKVHEQISASLIENDIKLLNSKILINHLGYNVSLEEKQKKALRNLELLKKEYEASPTGYYAYQLANTCFILGDTDNYLKYYQIASESKELSKSIRAESYSNLALAAHKELNTQNALKLVTNSLELHKEQPFTHLLAAKIYLQEGNKAKSEEFCRKAYNLNQKLLQNQSLGEIQIYLDNEEIIWFGLLLAYQNNNRENFNFYLKECKNHYRGRNSELSDSIHTIIEKLLSKGVLISGEENVLLNLLNKNTSEFLYTLIENNLASISQEFIERLFNTNKTNPDIIKVYSKFYFEHNDIEKAIKVLEENSGYIMNDSPAMLYLISYHLTLGNFDKVEKWIEIVENNFHHLSQVTSIIKNIKEKILLIKKN